MELNKIPVLDHGYVALVESWGSDSSIVESARMSTNKGFLGWGPTTKCSDCGVEQFFGQEALYQTVAQMGCLKHTWETKPGDEKLLRYLYENAHSTPFEMAGMIIEVQAPIFVFREWHRHRTQSYNELSARYTPLPDLNYVPTVERLLVNSKTNKQAGVIKGADELTDSDAQLFREELESMYRAQEDFYQRWLHKGVPKELARIDIPVGRYSRMRASANLRNWLAFLTLRSEKNPGAQWEIRQFANVAASIIHDRFPRTYEFFNEKR